MGYESSISIYELDDIKKYMNTRLGEIFKGPKKILDVMLDRYDNDLKFEDAAGYNSANPNYKLKYSMDEMKSYKLKKYHVMNKRYFNKHCKDWGFDTANDKKEFIKYVNVTASSKLEAMMKRTYFEEIFGYIHTYKCACNITHGKLYGEAVIESLLLTAYDKKIIRLNPLEAYYRLINGNIVEMSKQKGINIKRICKRAVKNKTQNELYSILDKKHIIHGETGDWGIHFLGIKDSKIIIDVLKRAWIENWQIDINYLKNSSVFCSDEFQAKKYRNIDYIFFKEALTFYCKSFAKLIKMKFNKPILCWWVG